MATVYPTMADVEPRETEYLLAGLPRIPKGGVSIVFGEGSVGKGRLVASWIAEVINSDPHAVVIGVWGEDNASEQVAPRLMEAGVADLSRVINMTRLQGGSRFKLSASATHPGHIGLLRECVESVNKPVKGKPRRRVALIVLDPLSTVCGWGSIQSNDGARRLLESVDDVCADTGAACVIIAHTVSTGKLQGSMGLSQAARVIYRVHADPAQPTTRLISVAKANNLPETPPMRFVIEDHGDGPRVIMLTPAEIERRQASWRRPVDAGASTAILGALGSALVPLTPAQIADMTGLSLATVRTLAWRMTRRGQLIAISGMYRLPSSKRATA
jgi:hypothetical protein